MTTAAHSPFSPAGHAAVPPGPGHVYALPMVRELTPPPATQGEPRTW